MSTNPTPPDLERIDILTLYQMLRELRTEILDTIKVQVSGPLATLNKNTLETRAILDKLAKDLGERSVQRLELEIQEGEEELKRYQERITSLEEKLNIKKSAKEDAVDTAERIKAITKSTMKEYTEAQQDTRAQVWRKRWDSIVTAVLVTLAVGAVGSIISFIGYYVLEYLRNKP